MSSLTAVEKRVLEDAFEMGGGYVLDFSDRTFGEFFVDSHGIDIHDRKYQQSGGSKANKLRGFWKLESDTIVADSIRSFVDLAATIPRFGEDAAKRNLQKARDIALRLSGGSSPISLRPLVETATAMNLPHLLEQLARLQVSAEKDPSLAIGTSKELLETICKTILHDRGLALPGTPEIGPLIRETSKALKLLPEQVNEASRGSETIRRILQNLGQVSQGISELRNLYGTGHGREGRSGGLGVRHARLALGTAATLAQFLVDTHMETKT